MDSDILVQAVKFSPHFSALSANKVSSDSDSFDQPY